MALFIGLMSGTSADGIDVVLVDFTKNKPFQIIATYMEPWTKADQDLINNLCSAKTTDLRNIGLLGNTYAQTAARAINKLLKAVNIGAERVTAIASRGKTIRHEPHLGYSMQIANNALLATLTKIDVVADFRSMDIALGGQGAPVVPIFHNEILRSPNSNRFIVNIGGISNVSALIPNHDVIGFDTGPGNTMLDLMARNLLGQPHDTNGDVARKGKIHYEVIDVFLKEPYFELKPPKSTGRELFNGDFLNRCQFFQTFSIEDKFATITELTALTIIDGINALQYRGEIFLCGGGIHNTFLVERIKEHAITKGHRYVGLINELGVDPDYIEALAFAWLGYKFVNAEKIDMKNVTGASKPAIYGCLYPHP